MRARQAVDGDMAAFCVGTGVQPSEYLHLTVGQREAFLRAARKAGGSRGSR